MAALQDRQLRSDPRVWWPPSPAASGGFSSAPEDGRHHTADLAAPLAKS